MKEMKRKSSYKIQIKSQITGSPYLSADYRDGKFQGEKWEILSENGRNSQSALKCRLREMGKMQEM